MPLICFAGSILITMFALLLMIDDPEPGYVKNLCIDILDWIAFLSFVFAVVVLCFAIVHV